MYTIYVYNSGRKILMQVQYYNNIVMYLTIYTRMRLKFSIVTLCTSKFKKKLACVEIEAEKIHVQPVFCTASELLIIIVVHTIVLNY